MGLPATNWKCMIIPLVGKDTYNANEVVEGILSALASASCASGRDGHAIDFIEIDLPITGPSHQVSPRPRGQACVAGTRAALRGGHLYESERLARVGSREGRSV